MNNIEKKFRYPGPRPFETEDASLFFGRKEDAENLYRQILTERVSLLYAKSGLGKSSLVNAAVIPLLQQHPEFELIKVRFGNYNPEFKGITKDNENVVLLEKVICNIQGESNPETQYLDKIIPNENSLWYRLKQSQFIEKDRTILFIFDQFEELFTYKDETIFPFKKQLANLIFIDIPPHIRAVFDRKLDKNPDLLSKEEMRLFAKPLNVKILFIIRNDRMSELNRIADFFPNILKSYYELRPLTKMQAQEAIAEPARRKADNFQSPNFEFAPLAITHIIQNLTENGTENIESFQLQMVCRYAEELIIENKTQNKVEISSEDLGNIQDIFAKNYNKTLAEIPSESLQKVRILIEEKLIVGGNRVPIPEIVILQQDGIPQTVIEKLLNSHLLRAERNSTGGRSIELSHDTLVAPILQSLEKRKIEERRTTEEKLRIAKEKQLIEQLALEKAEKQKQQKQLVIVRSLLIVSVIALLFAIGGIWYAFTQTKEANHQKEIAEEQTKIANEALEKYKTEEIERKKQEIANILKDVDDYINLSECNAALKEFKKAYKIDSLNFNVKKMGTKIQQCK